MEKCFYLRKVTAVIEDEKAAVRFDLLVRNLLSSKIECTTAQDINAFGISPLSDGAKDILGDVCKDGGMGRETGQLWVTDSPACAEALCRLGLPFAVYFHPGNRDKVFHGARFGMERPWELDAEYLENVYRRLAGIPWDIAQTKRCLIRETCQGDVESFRGIYSDPSVQRYARERYPDTALEKEYVRAYIDKQYGFYNYGVWTVVQKADGAVIGRAGFSGRAGYELPELGYVIGAPWQRQGMAYEVCRAVLDYGKEELGFERVQTLVETENRPSYNLCLKLGFRVMETVREDGCDCFRMEIIL